MRNLVTVVYVLVTVLVPVGLLCNLCYDLAHPELWSDWQHDPRLYGIPAIVLGPLFVWFYVRDRRKAIRWEARNARLDSMLAVVKRLLLTGQREEGDEAYSLYHRFKAAGNKQEEDRLAKQFTDLYGT
jgi:hypothetical protein